MSLNIARTQGTIFRPQVKGKYVQANFSTGKKQSDGSYRNSNFIIRFIGHSFEPAKSLRERDKITITNGFIENIWDKENNRNWLTLIVFDFELPNGGTAQPTDGSYTEVETPSELPF